MVVRITKKKSKNQSYFSHDFVISNHGDIVSFAAMLIVMGLLYKGTHAFSSHFIFLKHNVSDETQPNSMTLYSPGRSDFGLLFFYTLMCIVAHAVLQEYIFDRFVKKIDLTKSRLGKLNESAHLTIFYLVSVIWAIYNVSFENLLPNINSLWDAYPCMTMPFWTKMFMIIQICYWLHDFPELYFQRVKKDLMPERIMHATMFLIGITAAYFTGMTNLCIILLTLHYATDFFLHLSRALHLAEYTYIASYGFMLWNVLFIPVRMVCTILSFLTLHYGLAGKSVSKIDLSSGNFNTPSIRYAGLAFLFITQAYMVWNFITFHQRSQRGLKISGSLFSSSGASTASSSKRKDKKKPKREDDETKNGDHQNHVQRELRRRKPVSVDVSD